MANSLAGNPNFLGSGNAAGNYFGGQSMMGPLGKLFTDFFGGRGPNPYDQGMQAAQQGYGRASQYQNPFYRAGTGALPNIQDYLNKMADPQKYLAGILGGYQESPWATTEKQAAMRAATNAASASGLTGSTPYMQAVEEGAGRITSQDMQQYLANVLGIGGDYLQGEQGLAGMGQHAADMQSQLQAQLAQIMAQGEFEKAKNQREEGSSFWGDIFGVAGQALPWLAAL